MTDVNDPLTDKQEEKKEHLKILIDEKKKNE